jgi:hypothetical protein
VTDRTTRFVLCSTPAQGHTAPLLALAERLVHDGHEVVFFTTEHYRDRVMATGAGFVPFDPAYDAHDLMVANPDRESSARRGVRGVKDDLRQIFIGPIPGQYRDLQGIVEGFAPDCIVVDSMFFGALPYALGPRTARPALLLLTADALRHHQVLVVAPAGRTLARCAAAYPTTRAWSASSPTTSCFPTSTRWSRTAATAACSRRSPTASPWS